MSGLIVVDSGEEAFLDLILGVNYTLRLTRSDPGLLLPDSFTTANFTEANFTGYSAKALTGGLWTTTPGAPSVAVYAQQAFIVSTTGTAQTIYGYYVTRTSDGVLQWFERFDVPIVMEFEDDQINVTPRLTLRDEADPV